MDELKGDQWVEQSRWIKYEEAREEGADRWGKPHVSSLSFHSLLNLRLSLEKGKYSRLPNKRRPPNKHRPWKNSPNK